MNIDPSSVRFEVRNTPAAPHSSFRNQKVQHSTMHTDIAPNVMRLQDRQLVIIVNLRWTYIVIAKTAIMVTRDSTLLYRKAGARSLAMSALRSCRRRKRLRTTQVIRLSSIPGHTHRLWQGYLQRVYKAAQRHQFAGFKANSDQIALWASRKKPSLTICSQGAIWYHFRWHRM